MRPTDRTTNQPPDRGCYSICHATRLACSRANMVVSLRHPAAVMFVSLTRAARVHDPKHSVALDGWLLAGWSRFAFSSPFFFYSSVSSYAGCRCGCGWFVGPESGVSPALPTTLLRPATTDCDCVSRVCCFSVLAARHVPCARFALGSLSSRDCETERFVRFPPLVRSRCVACVFIGLITGDRSLSP